METWLQGHKHIPYPTLQDFFQEEERLLVLFQRLQDAILMTFQLSRKYVVSAYHVVGRVGPQVDP